MIAPALLIIFAIGALLVPDMRAESGIWIMSGVLIVLAVVLLAFGRSGPRDWSPGEVLAVVGLHLARRHGRARHAREAG